ncbi:MAG: bifunctional alpha/beta hydrolase/class I SAM-dependent methyltransferase [Acidobacteria bacterium]|nr:bifunctional alpha/beta hydrolase/class I SAM-dependent methyltransferase [Acidobacteriota bacterium]
MNQCTLKSFTSFDGQAIAYRHWPASSDTAVILFHRGHEHSGRIAHLVSELGGPHAYFAWDARGHGLSPTSEKYLPSAADSVRDIQCFVDHITQSHGIPVSNMIMVAQSVAAVQVAAWLHDCAPQVRGAVLASPAFEIKLYVPLARSFLNLWYRIRGDFEVKSYVKARHLTRDIARQRDYENDPLITRPISAKLLLELDDMAKRIVEDAEAIDVPVQLLISGRDYVVRSQPQHRFFEKLGSAFKERRLFSGLLHDILGERDRTEVVNRVRIFIEQCFDVESKASDLTSAHLQGFTRREMDRLESPSTGWRRFFWACNRIGLRLGKYLSSGIAIGFRSGFDSGASLDYVYENRPSGFTVLGRWIDRLYLNAIGWRGIRARKVMIEALTQTTAQLLRSKNMPIRILDIAAGGGRYLLDHAKEIMPDYLLLRDACPHNVKQCQTRIQASGMADWARAELGDAFDQDTVASSSPSPTLVIVSGLYELFSDNEKVAKSLAGCATAVPSGGYLIYTGQPWHPQLEMIARCLPNHRDGGPWVMRRRSQLELDQLVEAAGFRKIKQHIDDFGIFSVCLAVRVDA